MRRSAVFFDAFLDGFTMAGFSKQLRRPGAPTQVFEDKLDERQNVPAYEQTAEVSSKIAPLERENLAPPVRALVPRSVNLERLSDEQTRAVLQSIDKENTNQHHYAMTGMVCGTVCFLSCVGASVYLFASGHNAVVGGVFLGAAVLSVVERMIRGRE